MMHEGACLAERFELRRMVGQGRFGEVWAARDLRHDADVAIKHLHRDGAFALRSLKRELEALVDLRHPGLVTVDELVWHEGAWLLVMELVEGEPLDTWMAGDAGRVRRALQALAPALATLHGAGFVHRDICPANVRVMRDGRIVLLDLGLASQRGRPDAVFGHLQAVAPEQLERRPITPAVDWYALGALAFEALAGRPPFAGRGAQVLAQKRARAPSLASFAEGVPEELLQLVDALLLPDPDERMARAGPLLRAVGVDVADAPRSAFIGRGAELETLLGALMRARTARVHLRVLGGSGFGKSALIDRFAQLHVPEAYRARAYLQHAFPFAGLDELTRRMLERLEGGVIARHEHTLRAALGEARPLLENEGALDVVVDALRWLLTSAASGDVPLTLVLDDAHWADADAMHLLGRALVVVARPLLLVTIARREDELGALGILDERFAPTETLHVGGMDEGSLCHLAELAGSEDASQIAAAAQGSPLWALTMARGSAGADLEEALDGRIRVLSEGAQRVLRVLSAAGRPIERALVLEVASAIGVPNAFRVLSGLAAERLVMLRHSDTFEVEVAHDAIARAASVRDVGLALEVVHAAFDDALTTLGIDAPAHQARHAIGAGRTERGVGLLVRAAEQAYEALAFERAAALAAEVLSLGVPLRSRRGLHRLRGRALASAGHQREAAQAFEQALGVGGDGDDDDALEIARARAEALLHAGDLVAGYEALTRVLGAVGMSLPSPRAAVAELILHRIRVGVFGLELVERETSRALCRQVDVCFSMGIALTNVDSFRGAALVWRSLSLARRLGDRARFARSLAYVAAYACSGGGRVAPFAGHLIERAEALAQDAYTGAMVEAARSLFAFHRGDFEETLARTTELEERFMRLAGASRERVTARIYQGASLAMLGAFEPLAHHRTRLILDAEARADRFALVNALSGVFNLESLARDAVPEARAELERARALWGDTATTVQHFFFWLAEARVDLYEGRVEEAIERTERERPRLERALLSRMPFVRAHLDDLRGRAELMRSTPELRVVRRAISALRRERATWIDALADALEHAEARLVGDASRAQLAAARARAGFERHGMRAHLHALELDVHAEGIRDLTRFRRALGVDPALAAAH